MISDVSQQPADRRLHRAGAAALLIAAIAAAALAGCGGGGSSTGSQATTSAGAPGTSTSAQGTTTSTGSGNVFGGASPAEGHTVSDVLDAVLTSGDPDKACGTDYVTEHYLSVAYGGEQGCVQAQKPQSAAQSLDILGLTGSGSNEAGKATVKVAAHGGVYDGEKLTATLEKDGQNWKLDALKSNAPVGP